MSASTKVAPSPLESALVRVIARGHGCSPARVSLDRIMATLPTVMPVVPRRPYVERALETLKRRGILSATGAGWRVERVS